MLSYIFGSSPEENTNYIYDEIQNRTDAGENSFILVPEQYSMFSERELLSRLGFSAQKKVQVLTFSRLSNIILSANGPLRLKYIDSAGKNMLCQRAVQLLFSKLSYFSKSCGQKGFSSVLVKTFSEFKRYGITPQALLNASEETEDKELSAKLFELSALYEKYNLLLNEKNSDAEDNLSLIIPQIKDFKGINGKFFVNHFKSFTPVEEEALFALMQNNDFLFSFFSDGIKNPNGIFKSAKNTYKTIKDFAEKNGITSSQPIFLTSSEKEKNPEIIFLKDNFLNPRPNTYPTAPQNISLLCPANIHGEINCAADKISYLLHKEGLKLEDFLILIPKTEVYEDIIPVVFEKYGINYFMDSKTLFASKPFIRFFTAILEIAAYGFSYERIMVYLKSGFLNISERDIDIFENYLLASGFSHKHYQSEKPFSFNPDKKLFNLEYINRIKEVALNPLINFIGLKGRKSVKKINQAVLALLLENHIKENYQKQTDLFLKQGNTELAKDSESVWNTLMTVLAQADDLFGSTAVTFKKYYEIFTSAISDIKIGSVPPLINQVIISETQNFRTTDAKVVMVLGCLEGDFPKSFSEDGLISDKERDELFEKGIVLAPGAFDKQWDEQLLVYSVITSPKEKLILSAPIAASDGSELLCSDIFSDIKNVFPLLTEELYDENNISKLPQSRESAFDSLLIMLCKNQNNPKKLPPLWKALYNEFEKISEYKKRLDNIRQSLDFEKGRDKLDKKTAKLLYGEPLLMSVSKLEKYNSCAFSYFLTYGLMANERKKASLQSSDIGTVLHYVLSVYFAERKKETADYRTITKKAVQREVEKIIKSNEELAESVIYETSSYYRYMLLKIADIATATAWKIVKFYAQSSFRPYGFEIKIDSDGTFPPYTVVLEDGEAKIRGFIDRMDVFEKDGKKFFNIVDYKSSDKKTDPHLAEIGVRFQPLLYAGIVKENLENSQPAAMMYMKMDDPTAEFSKKPTEEELEKNILNQISLNGIITEEEEILKELDEEYGKKDAVHFTPTGKNCTYPPKELEKMINQALETAKQTTKKISEGGIEINPIIEGSKFNACQYCKFSSCCKINY